MLELLLFLNQDYFMSHFFTVTINLDMCSTFRHMYIIGLQGYVVITELSKFLELGVLRNYAMNKGCCMASELTSNGLL